MNFSYSEYHITKKSQQLTDRGQIRYVAEVQHTLLNTHRYLVDREPWMLENKIKEQFDKWDEIWSKNWNKSQIQLEKEVGLNTADERTKECQEKFRIINDLLKDSIGKNYYIDWNAMIDKRSFDIPNPKKGLQIELDKLNEPIEEQSKFIRPKPDQSFYIPRLSLTDKLFKNLAQKKILKADELYNEVISDWEKHVETIEKLNSDLKEKYKKDVLDYERERKSIQEHFSKMENDWEQQMDEYYLKQNEYNLRINELKGLYNDKNSVAIVEYCEII